MKFNGREFLVPALIALALPGCAARGPVIPAPLDLPKKVQQYATIQGETTASTGAPATRIGETPKPPVPAKASAEKQAEPAPPPAPEEANITLTFDQIPLPAFVQAVYGSILKRNVNLDPAVTARQDLITIRTGAPQTPSQVTETARMLLKSYGIAVIDLGSLVRIVPDNANLGYLPEIRRGRALPETPLPLRPIFHLVELQAVRNTDIAAWIRIMFGDKVRLQEDPNRNAVLLSGAPDDVMAALEAVAVLDQPLMKGRHSARITPIFWSAEELAKKLAEILQAEGYSAGPPGGISLPVTLVPVAAVNSIMVFAADAAILEHVTNWAKELDKATEKSSNRNVFSYQVQYTDANTLASTLEKLLTGIAKPVAAGAAPAAVPSRVVVDQASNTLIVQGSNEEFSQIRSLLQTLDRPAKEALIEVTVAEIRLTDDSQLGVEWLIKEARLDGTKILAGTLGGLSIGGSGFTYRRFDSAGDTRLLLNALASNNRATILSTPRVMARNGETATIQVGQEVPVITSQQTTPTTGGTGGVLQTVQYRSTGVILRVKPVIHSGNQIDLDVNQEVSAAQSTTTGVNVSPTFSTRRLDTRLSLKDGATVMLGGLISDNRSDGNAGIPLFKDIPVLGQLFRTNTEKKDRTELIILITPYVINDDRDAQAVTEAFQKQLGDWAKPLPKSAQTAPVGKDRDEGKGQ